MEKHTNIERAARLWSLYGHCDSVAERCAHEGITAAECEAGRKLHEQRERDHAVRCAVYGDPANGWAGGAKLATDSEDEMERARR